MKTARLIRIEQWLLSEARVYELSELIEYEDDNGVIGTTGFVVVSARSFVSDRGGPEVMAFACDTDGEWLPDADHVSVSEARSVYHPDALRTMGFEVDESDEDEIRERNCAETVPVDPAALKAAVDSFNAERETERRKRVEMLDVLKAQLASLETQPKSKRRSTQ